MSDCDILHSKTESIELSHGPVAAVDHDAISLGNVRRGSNDADHSRETEFSGHDGSMREKSSEFGHNSGEQREVRSPT